MSSFAKRATIIKTITDVDNKTDGIYSFHVYKDNTTNNNNKDKRIMYFCLKSTNNISLWKLDLNCDYLRKHVSIVS